MHRPRRVGDAADFPDAAKLLLLRFSQELHARQILLDLKKEVLRFSRNLGLHLCLRGGGSGEAAVEDALAALAARRERAMAARRERAMAARARAQGLDRPGAARGAIRGLRFISRSRADAWGDVEGSFEKLARKGFLSRSDFAQCIAADDLSVINTTGKSACRGGCIEVVVTTAFIFYYRDVLEAI